jgi:hypothetical protein
MPGLSPAPIAAFLQFAVWQRLPPPCSLHMPGWSPIPTAAFSQCPSLSCAQQWLPPCSPHYDDRVRSLLHCLSNSTPFTTFSASLVASYIHASRCSFTNFMLKWKSLIHFLSRGMSIAQMQRLSRRWPYPASMGVRHGPSSVCHACRSSTQPVWRAASTALVGRTSSNGMAVIQMRISARNIDLNVRDGQLTPLAQAARKATTESEAKNRKFLGRTKVARSAIKNLPSVQCCSDGHCQPRY